MPVALVALLVGCGQPDATEGTTTSGPEVLLEGRCLDDAEREGLAEVQAEVLYAGPIVSEALWGVGSAVYDDEAAWAPVRDELFPPGDTAAPAPEVDFSSNQVVLVGAHVAGSCWLELLGLDVRDLGPEGPVWVELSVRDDSGACPSGCGTTMQVVAALAVPRRPAGDPLTCTRIEQACADPT